MLMKAPERTDDGLMSAYRARIEAGTILPDPVQRRAAERLHELWSRLRGYDPTPKAPPNGWLGRLLNKKRVDEVPEDYPSGLYLVGDADAADARIDRVG